MKMLPRSESIYLAVLALVLSYAYDVPLNTHKLDFWDANQVVGLPERPSTRAHHTMNYLGGRIFIFGGIGAGGSVLGDLHFYDTLTRVWSGEIAREWCCDQRGAVVDTVRGYLPPVARTFHAAVAEEENSRLYVLGGYNDEIGDLSDVQYFDPGEMRWSGPLEMSGPLPLARSGHVAFLEPHGTRLGDAIYMFGGYSSTGGHLNDLNRLSLSVDDFHWSRVEPAHSTSGGGGGLLGGPAPLPSARRHAAVATLSQSAILLGGLNAPTVMNDVGVGLGGGNATDESAMVFGDAWRLSFDGIDIAWEEIDLGASLPRFHHTCVVTQEEKRLLIMGGGSPTSWSSTITTATTSFIKTFAAKKTDNIFSDVSSYTLNLDTSEWTPAPMEENASSPPSCESNDENPRDISSASRGFPENGTVSAAVTDEALELGLRPGLYGHATVAHGGLVYEFGGYRTYDGGGGLGDSEGGAELIEDGVLRVFYLADGRTGAVCPVRVENV